MREPARFTLHRGLDLEIPGRPRQVVSETREPDTVALLGHDHPRVRCDLRVAVGDRVRIGETLFVDRLRPEIRFTSPASGVVSVAQSEQERRPTVVVVERDGSDDLDRPESFGAAKTARPRSLDRAEVARLLLASGQWPSIRVRPGGGLPDPGSVPDAIFVRAIDTHPLAPLASAVLAERLEEFRIGVEALSRLTDGPVFVCSDPDTRLDLGDLDRVHAVSFRGPHPAGLVGTHIHHLFPLRDGRRVWYTGYQETAAMGHLFRTGHVDSERVVSLAGPMVREPRLLRTRLGASTEDLVRSELLPGECRIVSGSLLSGRRAATTESYLGRFHDQVSVVPERLSEARNRRLLPTRWGSRSVPFWRRGINWTTGLGGRPRAMLPMHSFEAVVPLRIPVALLLRSLAARDFEAARAFGASELEEADLALCSYLCPSKLEYGTLLREALDQAGTDSE